MPVRLGLCEDGQGLDVHGLFMKPLEHAGLAELRARCKTPGPGQSMSGLGKLAMDALERNSGSARVPGSGEWVLLRHLYWVN